MIRAAGRTSRAAGEGKTRLVGDIALETKVSGNGREVLRLTVFPRLILLFLDVLLPFLLFRVPESHVRVPFVLDPIKDVARAYKTRVQKFLGGHSET